MAGAIAQGRVLTDASEMSQNTTPLTLRVGLAIPWPQQEAAGMSAEPLRILPESIDCSLSRAPDMLSGAREKSRESPDERAARRAIAAVSAHHAAGVPPLERDDAVRAAGLTLPDFYAEYLYPLRKRQVADGSYQPGSWGAERTAINQYAAFDRASPPAGWPPALDWSGMPLRDVSPAWLEAFVEQQAAKGLAAGTINSRLLQLYSVFGYARKMGVCEGTPRIRQQKRTIRRRRAASGDEDGEMESAVAYTDGQLADLYRNIDAAVQRGLQDRVIKARSAKALKTLAAAIRAELKTALVLAVNCGPRPSDLFMLDFERHVRLNRDPPELAFTASKTGKLHRLPLANVTVDHLQRLRKRQGLFLKKSAWVFPSLSNPTLASAKKRSNSKPQKRTVALMRLMLHLAGLDPDLYEKPLHSLRKTATTRFNLWGAAHKRGPVGTLMTHGKDANTACESYFDVWPTLIDAVQSIDWPF